MSGTSRTPEFLWALAPPRCEEVETPEEIGFNPNYALEAERDNALVGFNPDLATLSFHQEGFL